MFDSFLLNEIRRRAGMEIKREWTQLRAPSIPTKRALLHKECTLSILKYFEN
jgi:hypothetical protein